MTNDRRLPAGVLIAIVVTGMATVALGRHAWWIVPSAVFVGTIAYAAIDRRRPLTLGWVLFVALIAIVLGIVLRFL